MTDPAVFPPTLREVMLRPRWIGALLLALVVAGVFAWLGQWQLGNAIDTDPPPADMTETVRPLEEVVEPGAYLAEPLVGQRVEATGSFVPGDFIVVSSRFQDGEPGYWVTGQFRIDGQTPASLAVAVGWTDDRAEADVAASALDADPPRDVTLTGRLISDEGPRVPGRGADAFDLPRMSPVALLSRWSDTDGVDVYRPYLVSAEAFGGLQQIHAPAPDAASSVNWLNIFYAVEWAVFAGFACYMWYRLAKDAWEKELEELEEDAGR